PSVAVINKSDLETAIDMDYIKKNVRNVVFISAKSGSGASELEKVVSDIISTSQLDPSAAIIALRQAR
ncbi:MAG: tRNA uridine-5-carboxymethylaminomethyl(34) synthesis GTPase MnmE, partial [Dehalococcoidia bacterium]